MCICDFDIVYFAYLLHLCVHCTGPTSCVCRVSHVSLTWSGSAFFFATVLTTCCMGMRGRRRDIVVSSPD